MDRCIACAADYHEECYVPLMANDDGDIYCCCPADALGGEPSVRGPLKIGIEMRDVLSTGRKRAANAFPLPGPGEPPMDCEWKGLRNAGGGVKPIVGCFSGNATDRHHGPDKSTLNNEPGNVHRICSTCHNRWHARNDPHYGKRPDAGLPFVPVGGLECLDHDPLTEATTEEIVKAGIEWQSNPQTRKSETSPLDTQ